MTRTTNAVILAKIEGTYGVSSAPTGVDAMTIAGTLTYPELVSEMVALDRVRTTFGSQQMVAAGNHHHELTLEFEVAASGTAGTAPALDPVMRACGMAKTTTTGTSVRYTPATTGHESVTVGWFCDGFRVETPGWRGSPTITLQNNQIGRLSIPGRGLYTAPTDTALPAPQYTFPATPQAVSVDNTLDLSLLGFACVMDSFTFNAGVETTFVARPNGTRQVLITASNASGEITIENPTVAQKNYVNDVLAGTVGSFSLRQGIAAGSRFGINSSQVQVMQPRYSTDANNILMLTLGLNFMNYDITLS